MPELPEVETVRRALEAAVGGQRLRRVELGRKKLRLPLPRRALAALAGFRLTALGRRGKVLLLCLAGSGRREQVLLVHLGMSGRLLATAPVKAWERHEHARLHFERRCVRFIDPRRFGSLELCPADGLPSHPRVRHLGPEPLSEAFDGAVLHAAARGLSRGVRDLLIDGRRVAGVGNIYANEACFQAGVRPTRRSGRLARGEADRLAAAVKDVLSHAVAAGGSALADGGDVDPLGNEGWFHLETSVYGRAGEPCRRCGATVRRIVLGQRSAFYCPRCQR